MQRVIRLSNPMVYSGTAISIWDLLYIVMGGQTQKMFPCYNMTEIMRTAILTWEQSLIVMAGLSHITSLFSNKSVFSVNQNLNYQKYPAGGTQSHQCISGAYRFAYFPYSE